MSPLVLLLAAAGAQPLVAIVVVDQEARDSGYAVEVDGWLVEDALPVDVAEGEHVVIVEPDGRTEPLDVAPGEAWEVTGEMGEAWMSRLDEEIRTDLIAVRGSDESIEALAQTLDADIVIDDDMIYLSGEGVLFDAPWVNDEIAIEVEEVALVAVETDEEPEQQKAPTAPTEPVRTAVSPATTPKAVGTPAPAFEPPPPKLRNTKKCPDKAAPAEPKPAPKPSLMQTSGDFGSDDDLGAYAGMHLCRDDVLWLHPAGVYSFRGVSGTWNAPTPGVVRLYTDGGDVLFRASISPENGHCRDVWSPEETGQAMPEGYETVQTESRKRFFRNP